MTATGIVAPIKLTTEKTARKFRIIPTIEMKTNVIIPECRKNIEKMLNGKPIIETHGEGKWPSK